MMDFQRAESRGLQDRLAEVPNRTVADLVTPDMLHLIDPYWYQFPPMNPLWHWILGFVIGVLGLVGLAGNAVVIYVFCTTKSLRSPSNLLVLSLALSDLLMMLTNSPMMVISAYYETWVLGPLGCDLYGFFGGVSGFTSIWSMTLIARDRYNVIVKGLNVEPLTYSRAALNITLLWFITSAWSILPLFGWSRYVPEGNMISCGTDYLNKDWFHKSYLLIFASMAYFTPLFTIMYSYFWIVKTVSTHEKQMKDQAKRMNVESLRNDQKASQEIRLAKIALMTISLWFMAWTPYLVINFTAIFNVMPITPFFSVWGAVFAKANSTYNPIVYAISHPKYQRALYRKFPSLACGGGGPPADDAPASVATEVSQSANTGQSTSAA